MEITALLVKELDQEATRTRQVLEKLPADQWDSKLGEGFNTLGWLANHLTDLVGWAPMIVNASEFDMAPPDGPAYETPNLQDPAEILAKFNEYIAAGREAIATASDAQLEEMWTLKSGGQPYFTITKYECLRTWVFNHMIHHRAILAVHLRLRGIELTGVYDG